MIKSTNRDDKMTYIDIPTITGIQATTNPKNKTIKKKVPDLDDRKDLEAGLQLYIKEIFWR